MRKVEVIAGCCEALPDMQWWLDLGVEECRDVGMLWNARRYEVRYLT